LIFRKNASTRSARGILNDEIVDSIPPAADKALIASRDLRLRGDFTFWAF